MLATKPAVEAAERLLCCELAPQTPHGMNEIETMKTCSAYSVRSSEHVLCNVLPALLCFTLKAARICCVVNIQAAQDP